MCFVCDDTLHAQDTAPHAVKSGHTTGGRKCVCVSNKIYVMTYGVNDQFVGNYVDQIEM